ncbi:response regulator transcription factor [Paenibacillus sp. SYP-B4298]|uniref:response regulator transcription factor n=1 Tax=Paenibacillus sp. SYP-B4298 TaxID=2996034 RepID=UPI0022DD95B6|nr:response regulator transcription factor [Paenibacillus sp. SYP-B4298]
MNSLCKVLIVDDEILVRQGIKHYLNWEQEGFQIVGEASNGQEALDRIATLQPHIVITDIVMPVMDGEKLTRMVKQHFPEIEIIVLSAFGEFDYVRSSFQSGVADYILKPKLDASHLLAVLKDTAAKIPSLSLTANTNAYKVSIENILEKLLSGYEDHALDNELLKETFPYSGYALIGADLGRLSPQEAAPHAAALSQALEQLEAELESFTARRIPAEPNIEVYLANLDDSMYTMAQHRLGKLAQLARAERMETCWAMSEPFAVLDKLPALYRDRFLKLLGYRFFLPDKPLLIEIELPRRPVESPRFNLNQFTEDIKRQQFESAFHDLKAYVTALSSDYSADAYEFRSFLGNIIFNVTVMLSHMDYEVAELEEGKYEYFRHIEEARSAAEASKLLDEFLAAAWKCIYHRRNQYSNPNMKKLLDYIEQHYAEPLSLSEVAKHFHFNPSYLSSYFAANNKEGFSEYVNKLRIEKAEQLLREDGATIAEISGMVGYSDHSYFCKVFKKATGLAPSQYRRKHRR